MGPVKNVVQQKLAVRKMRIALRARIALYVNIAMQVVGVASVPTQKQGNHLTDILGKLRFHLQLHNAKQIQELAQDVHATVSLADIVGSTVEYRFIAIFLYKTK